MKNNKITYYEIAKAAHVGVGTVSRYFNNYYISNISKTKIQKVLKDLNYVPNFAAASIKKKSKDVYLIIPYNADETANLEIISGVKWVLNDHNINFFTFISTDESNKYIEDLRYIEKRNPIAIITLLPKVISKELKDQIKLIKSTNLIIYNQNIDSVQNVSIDDENLFQQFANQIDNQFKDKKILYIGLTDEDFTTGLKRRIGFTNNIINNKLDTLIVNKNDIKEVYEQLRKYLILNKIDIIICATHTISIAANQLINNLELNNKILISDIGGKNQRHHFINSDLFVFIDYFLIGIKIGQKIMENNLEN